MALVRLPRHGLRPEPTPTPRRFAYRVDRIFSRVPRLRIASSTPGKITGPRTRWRWLFFSDIQIFGRIVRDILNRDEIRIEILTYYKYLLRCKHSLGIHLFMIQFSLLYSRENNEVSDCPLDLNRAYEILYRTFALSNEDHTAFIRLNRRVNR